MNFCYEMFRTLLIQMSIAIAFDSLTIFGTAHIVSVDGVKNVLNFIVKVVILLIDA